MTLMIKKLIQALQFYRTIMVANLAVSLGALSLIYIYGTGPFVFIFWFKVAVLLFIIYVQSSSRSAELYYYMNLGISKKQLWTTAITVDLILFIILFVLTLKIRCVIPLKPMV